MPAFVQQWDGTGSSISGTATTAGSLLVLVGGNDTEGPQAINDSASNVWTRFGPTRDGYASFAYCVNAASITSISLPIGGSNSEASTLMEFSGVATSSAVDASSASAVGSPGVNASGSITTANAADLLVGFAICTDSSTASPGIPTLSAQTSGFTVGTASGDAATGIYGQSVVCQLAYEIVSSTGSYAYSVTSTTSPSGDAGHAITGIIAFKAAGGGSIALTGTQLDILSAQGNLREAVSGLLGAQSASQALLDLSLSGRT